MCIRDSFIIVFTCGCCLCFCCTGGLRGPRAQQRRDVSVAHGAQGQISGLHDAAPGKSRITTNHAGEEIGIGLLLFSFTDRHTLLIVRGVKTRLQLFCSGRKKAHQEKKTKHSEGVRALVHCAT